MGVPVGVLGILTKKSYVYKREPCMHTEIGHYFTFVYQQDPQPSFITLDELTFLSHYLVKSSHN